MSDPEKSATASFDAAGTLESGALSNGRRVEIDSDAIEADEMREVAEEKQRRHRHHRLHIHHRRKREVEKIAKKLPAFMHTEDNNVEEMRKRLTIKNETIAAVAEFCGTFLFLLFSFGVATIAGQQQLTADSASQVQGAADSAPALNSSQLLFSSLGFGFSLAVNAWIFFRVSGGLFNPAVTLGLFLAGAVSWYRAIILTVTQYVAAIAAAGVAQLITPGGINVRTKLGGATSIAQGFFIEFFCTALLMFAIFMLAGEKHKATFLAPVGIGLALFLSELWATGLTGGSLNPARSLGPDVIASEFDGTAWIYYLAPYSGAFVAWAFYGLLKYFNYESAVEGQDGDDIHLLMRDKDGNLTGFVDQVAAADAPEIAKMAPEERPIVATPIATPVATQFDPSETAAEFDGQTDVGLLDSKENGSAAGSGAGATSVGDTTAEFENEKKHQNLL
ncbi:Aquaporin-1 [Tilletia horrida]|uniref:Aquaporin-1 n=1 Tax=Tilletia horrida TaxID=155126 RepID=A0AAN6G7J7_9BASI|nr:Aquaporin-1 [Tilletia horrida]KAK0521957.1 Aquaporin-1 [Tilletia horrida]